MQIENAKNLRKTTLRERIYEEVVHLILSSELPSGGWVDEKQVRAESFYVDKSSFRPVKTGVCNPVPQLP